MANTRCRLIAVRVIRSSMFLLAAATLSTGQEIPPSVNHAPGQTIPNPSKGSVDSSGKFVPANPSAEAPKTPATPEEWRDSAARLIEKTGEHTFRIGIVQCDRATATLTIPAHVNAREGLIEYALVTRQGKMHESLLCTDAEPLHVQLAALLLGMLQPGEREQSCEVMIDVIWASNGPDHKLALEELVSLAKGSPQDASTGTMTRGPWKFTGSFIDSKGFVASREGSIIALIDDRAAIIANPRADREDDDLHVPNTAAMPGVGMPVSVCIRFLTPKARGGGTPVKP